MAKAMSKETINSPSTESLAEAAKATEILRAAAQRALTYVDKKEWLA